MAIMAFSRDHAVLTAEGVLTHCRLLRNQILPRLLSAVVANFLICAWKHVILYGNVVQSVM